MPRSSPIPPPVAAVEAATNPLVDELATEKRKVADLTAAIQLVEEHSAELTKKLAAAVAQADADTTDLVKKLVVQEAEVEKLTKAHEAQGAAIAILQEAVAPACCGDCGSQNIKPIDANAPATA
jgi:chromosome segregation ATPase